MPQTRVKTNHEPYQEPNGTNRKEHTTVGIPRGCFEPQGKGVAKRPADSIKLETDALNATNQRPHSRVRSDGKAGSASNPSENQSRTPKTQMQQMELNTQRLGPHWASLEPQGKRIAKRPADSRRLKYGPVIRNEPKTTHKSR